MIFAFRFENGLAPLDDMISPVSRPLLDGTRSRFACEWQEARSVGWSVLDWHSRAEAAYSLFFRELPCRAGFAGVAERRNLANASAGSTPHARDHAANSATSTRRLP